jgi:TPP-dependent 2-oxoacid decarboxylase
MRQYHQVSEAFESVCCWIAAGNMLTDFCRVFFNLKNKKKKTLKIPVRR